MTKQVFDQIAEGLREAAETPPAWAIEKAREVIAADFANNPKYQADVLAGRRDNEWRILTVARALAEADKAATDSQKTNHVICSAILDSQR